MRGRRSAGVLGVKAGKLGSALPVHSITHRQGAQIGELCKIPAREVLCWLPHRIEGRRELARDELAQGRATAGGQSRGSRKW